MKNIYITFSSCIAIAFVFLVGCSKSDSSSSSAKSDDQTASAATAAASGDPAELKVKWPIGEKYAMRKELEQSTETKVPNQPEPIQQRVKLTQDFDISALKELPNGGRQLELQFKGQTMSVNQGGKQMMAFDSKQPETQDADNPIAALLRKMVGARLLYLIDASGKVEKVEGVSELMTQIGFNRKSPAHAMFGQMFSEATLKQYAAFSEMLPNRTVKVGEGWTEKKEIDSGVGKLAVDVDYTFKNWEQYGDYKCARITAQGKMSSVSGASQPGSTVKIEKGTTSGDIWFDPDMGMMVNQIMDQDMTLNMMAGSTAISPHVKQRVRVSLEYKTAR